VRDRRCDSLRLARHPWARQVELWRSHFRDVMVHRYAAHQYSVEHSLDETRSMVHLDSARSTSGDERQVVAGWDVPLNLRGDQAAVVWGDR